MISCPGLRRRLGLVGANSDSLPHIFGYLLGFSANLEMSFSCHIYSRRSMGLTFGYKDKLLM